MRSGKLVIAEDGGPTAVINQSLVGAVLEAYVGVSALLRWACRQTLLRLGILQARQGPAASLAMSLPVKSSREIQVQHIRREPRASLLIHVKVDLLEQEHTLSGAGAT